MARTPILGHGTEFHGIMLVHVLNMVDLSTSRPSCYHSMKSFMMQLVAMKFRLNRGRHMLSWCEYGLYLWDLTPALQKMGSKLCVTRDAMQFRELQCTPARKKDGFIHSCEVKVDLAEKEIAQ